MPAYNEGEHIKYSIEETARTFDDFGCKWELIIIDDCSSDDTFKKAGETAVKYNGKIVIKKNPYNLGKGRAIKKALHYVTGDYVLFLDADMDLHPSQVRTLFDIMSLDNADVVIGSKFHPNSRIHYPFRRKVISVLYYGMVRFMFNLPCRDTQTGIKLFKAHVLRKVMPRILVKQFAFDLEILVNIKHLGYRIAEAPVVLNSRWDHNFIPFIKASFATLIDTCAVFYRMFILNYYDRIDYYRRKNLAKEFRKMRR
jgi:glycosyltransferase involved in cell wall biosynthesis